MSESSNSLSAQHRFHNRAAWKIASGEIEVSVTEWGGHLAETTWRSSGVNPLWVQDRPTIDPDQFDTAIHEGIYGSDSEALLISGLLGHNLCLPWWGPPSEAEFRAGMTYHGETNIVRWRAMEHSARALRIEALLPESALRVTRSLECRGPVVNFETVVENLSAWDRPLSWCEHVTLGPPFLSADSTRFYADLLRGFRTSREREGVFDWPEGNGERRCDLTRFSREPHSDLVNSFLVDAQHDHACFIAVNPQLGLAFGYVFRPRDFPWMNVWENNDARRQTRAMEFSNTPVEGSMKQLFAKPRLLDTPTFEWLEAKSSVTKKFFSFALEIPRDFGSVGSIDYNGQTLLVQEADSERKYAITID